MFIPDRRPGERNVAFEFSEDSLESTGRWLSLWAMLQRVDMRKGFREEGTNAALRARLTVILNDANRVSDIVVLEQK